MDSCRATRALAFIGFPRLKAQWGHDRKTPLSTRRLESTIRRGTLWLLGQFCRFAFNTSDLCRKASQYFLNRWQASFSIIRQPTGWERAKTLRILFSEQRTKEGGLRSFSNTNKFWKSATCSGSLNGRWIWRSLLAQRRKMKFT